jgi:hypothetical protein
MASGFTYAQAMTMPVPAALSAHRSAKALEAEARLGFIADVSMLFASKSERGHIQELIRQAGDEEPARRRAGRLKMDDERGREKDAPAYVPGKTYLPV